MSFIGFVLIAAYFVYNIIQVAGDQKAGLPWKVQFKDFLFGFLIDAYYWIKSKF
ncbi:hypothetical protein [Candidatus Magnetobacterium casense]|uniref:Uncharacterized protein n=1 Tax=Candidatus Magnetobacterium casense TaxID=1455061 RepID=A0ABS6S3Q6_9BACT|nr:hypothetical protein [Candidatus Magnetobacterium casensis]MBV6343482.1 hypothetical protein [Candidatus Magnetobacterium casensis]